MLGLFALTAIIFLAVFIYKKQRDKADREKIQEEQHPTNNTNSQNNNA